MISGWGVVAGILLVCAACGGGQQSSPSAPSTSTDSTASTPRDTSAEGVALAPLSGVLGGTVECPWVQSGSGRVALLWTHGLRVEVDPDGLLVLIAPDGSRAARSGEWVDLSGASLVDPDGPGGKPAGTHVPPGCDAGEVDSVFDAQAVTVGP